MTSRELVQAAIRHETPPHVPYLVRFTPEGLAVLQEQLGTQDAEAFVDNDVVGCSPPWWTWQGLAEDWKAIDPPTSRDHVIGMGNYSAFFDQLKRWRGETDKYILVYIWGSHWEKAYFARGIENFLADLAGEPEFARRFLRRIIERNLVMLEMILTAPEIDGVLLGSDWGTQQGLIMSRPTWEEMIRPGEQEEYDLIHGYGKDVWVHSCGNVEAIMPALIEMGVDVLNPVQPEAMDIAALKANYGDRITFWGGISTQRTLPYGTPDEVRAEARAVRDLLGNNGGFIYAPAQEIQSDVPAENILALLEVAREGR